MAPTALILPRSISTATETRSKVIVYGLAGMAVLVVVALMVAFVAGKVRRRVSTLAGVFFVLGGLRGGGWGNG